MNVFEEHQLFIPIINDSRFATTLRDHCNNDLTASFRNEARCAIKIIARENKLSLHGADIHEVTEVLWAYYENQLKEERTARDKAVYAAEGFDVKPSQAEREVSEWKLEAGRIAHAAFGMTDTYSAADWKQAVTRTMRMNNLTQPKESPTMATPTFVTITYVSGKPLDELTNDDLIAAIKACEKEIESLREVKRTSTKVATKIATLNDTADKIRDALDGRA